MQRNRKGFSIIPNSVILDVDLSNNAKLLYIYIKSLSENFRTLRNSNLKQKLGISTNTLQNCKAELVKYGYLKIYSSKSANYYFLMGSKANVNKIKSTQNMGG
jgi:hypothetical protein